MSTNISPFSPLEATTTSLWAASLHHHFQYCLLSAVIEFIFLSSPILSSHLRLVRTLLLFIGRCNHHTSSLLQCILFCLRKVDIWHTLAFSCMTCFLTWSFLVAVLIHRTILISSTFNLLSFFFLTAQHSPICISILCII